MPDAFYYPEHWRAVFTGKAPKKGWWRSLRSIVR